MIIVHQENPDARKEFGECHIFKVCMGARYLGAYVRDNNSKRNWLRERTLACEKKIGTIRKLRGNIPIRVMPRWHTRYNHSGYFYNASHGARGVHSCETKCRTCFKYVVWLIGLEKFLYGIVLEHHISSIVSLDLF